MSRKLLGMASDGDLYHTRLRYGFQQCRQVALQGGTVAEEAAMATAALQRALRKEYRVAALRPMLTLATRAVLVRGEAELFTDAPLAALQILRLRLTAVERRLAELPATPETRRIVEAVAHEVLESSQPIDALAFRQECKERLARWLLDRLHLKPTETEVRKALGLDRPAVLARQEAVFRACLPEAMRLMDEAELSPRGRPRPTKRSADVDVNSLAGLQEALVG